MKIDFCHTARAGKLQISTADHSKYNEQEKKCKKNSLVEEAWRIVLKNMIVENFWNKFKIWSFIHTLNIKVNELEVLLI